MERKLAKYLVLISLVFFTSQVFSQSQIKLLESAYEEDSDSLMQIFFENWKKDLPVSQYNYTDDTTKAAMELYKFLYEPEPLNEKNSKAVSDDANSYRIIKSNLLDNILVVYVMERIMYFQWYQDSEWDSYEPDNSRRDTLKPPELARYMDGKLLNKKRLIDFRPQINGSNIVFLDSTYSGIINYFVLGNFIKTSYTKYDRWTVKRNREEFQKRFDFLNRYLPILETGPRTIYEDGHTIGSGFDINGRSAINSIMIDKTLSFARVSTYTDCNQTIYYLEKKNGEWSFRKKEELCWCG